jgi:hypothetical protein
MNSIINKKYKIVDKIGSGKFGVVYKGTNLKNNTDIAIKLETKKAPINLLKNETNIMKYLYDHGSRSTPIVYWFGVDEHYNYLVMSHYNISLYDYFQKYSVSQEKIDKIMCACIDILENIHTKYVIHRDIKPQNFMISNEEIYLIDFGFATFYVNEKGDHLPKIEINNIVGTPKYVSTFIHNGFNSSRRDDLISLGYLYMYLFCKELPWDNLISNKSATDYEEIHLLHPKNQQRKALKAWNNIEPICLKINEKIHNFLNYCYCLNYESAPNYEALKKVFFIQKNQTVLDY